MAKKTDIVKEIDESRAITPSTKRLLQEKADQKDVEGTVSPIEQAVMNMTIASADDFVIAVELGGKIKSAQAFLEEKKSLLMKPLKELVKNTTAMFKPMEDSLDYIERTLKIKMMDFKEEERKKEAQALARVERGTMKPETALAKVEAMTDKTVLSATGAKATETFTTAYEVENVDLIPRQFLVPDMALIKASFKAGTPVAGVREYQKQGISF